MRSRAIDAGEKEQGKGKGKSWGHHPKSTAHQEKKI